MEEDLDADLDNAVDVDIIFVVGVIVVSFVVGDIIGEPLREAAIAAPLVILFFSTVGEFLFLSGYKRFF